MNNNNTIQYTFLNDAVTRRKHENTMHDYRRNKKRCW